MAVTNSDVIRLFDTPSNLSTNLKEKMIAGDVTNVRFAAKFPTIGMKYVSDDSKQLLLAGAQTVTGIKTWSANQIFSADIRGGFTLGSVLIADVNGAIKEANAGLFFDVATIELGVGTNTPSSIIDAVQAAGNGQIGLTTSGLNSTANLSLQNDSQQWLFRTNGSAADALVIRDNTAAADALTISASSLEVALNGELHLNKGSQNYIFSDRSNFLTLQGQLTGNTSRLELFTFDGDGTDDNMIFNYGLGTPGATTNIEYSTFGYESTGPQMEWQSRAAGTGTVRPIVLLTEGNADQLKLKADGDNSMSGNLLIEGTNNLYLGTTGSSIHRGALGACLCINHDGSGAGDDIIIENDCGDILFVENLGTVLRYSTADVQWQFSEEIVTKASTSTASGFLLTPGSDKTSFLNSGDMWYEGTSFKFRDGSTTRTLIWGVGGGIQLPTRTETGATITAALTDYTIRCDATAASQTVDLLAASSCTGQIFNIKKIDASGNTITLDGNGSETIDDVTTKVISTQYDTITIQSNGTGYDII